MLFKDRIDAGKRLADKINDRNLPLSNTVIIGLPRGGVPVAAVIAKRFKRPLDVHCVRKIGAPGHEEYAIGALSEKGVLLLNQEIAYTYDLSDIEKIKRKEKARIDEQVMMYKGAHERISLREKDVILVDDGLATGYTMRVAIESIRQESPNKVIVAIPVSSVEAAREISECVDEVIVVETPLFFQAVGQFYQEFSSVEDEEVIRLLKEINP